MTRFAICSRSGCRYDLHPVAALRTCTWLATQAKYMTAEEEFVYTEQSVCDEVAKLFQNLLLLCAELEFYTVGAAIPDQLWYQLSYFQQILDDGPDAIRRANDFIDFERLVRALGCRIVQSMCIQRLGFYHTHLPTQRFAELFLLSTHDVATEEERKCVQTLVQPDSCLEDDIPDDFC